MTKTLNDLKTRFSTPVAVYTCQGCGKAFWDDKYIDAKGSAEDHCGPEIEYGCPVCKYLFDTKLECEDHLKKPHVSEYTPNTDERYSEALRFEDWHMGRWAFEMAFGTDEEDDGDREFSLMHFYANYG